MSVLIFILVLSTLIIIHELGHFAVARATGMKVEVFSIGFGPVIFKLKLKTCDFLICAVPLGGYVKVAGFSQQERKNKPYEFLSKPIGLRALVIAAGPVFNYFLAWVLFCTVFVIGFSVPSARVGGFVEDHPAQLAGIEEGDLIVEIEGLPMKNWQDMSEFIHNTELASINLVVLRKNEKIDFTVSPKRETVKDLFGKERTFSFIGVYPSEELVKAKYPFPEAIKQGTLSIIQSTATTIKALGYMVIGAIPFKKTLTGPLGIYYITKQASSIGLSAVLHLMAILSMSLAIFNFMPFPVLDGGHIFFLFIEKVRGKALTVKTEDIINKIGISFIVMLVVFVLYNDIMRFGPVLMGKQPKLEEPSQPNE